MKRWTKRLMGAGALAMAFAIHFPQAAPAPLTIPAVPALRLRALHLP